MRPMRLAHAGRLLSSRLRPTCIAPRFSTSTHAAGLDLSQYDPTQLAMMEEACIVVDFDDNIVEEASKKEVHLQTGMCMTPAGHPHRAFSVFLFNEHWELLLQKRCSEKILFPLHWANTCCSHPLANGATFLGDKVYGEHEGPAGTILAARRKLNQELCISQSSLPVEDFKFVTKVHYKAALPGPDPKWGEHEMDYILLIQRTQAEIEATMQLNPNEVVDIKWVSQEACREFIRTAGDPHAEDAAGREGEWISPWFGEIEEHLLHGWWDALQRGDTVEPDGMIHRLKGGSEAIALYNDSA